MKPTELLEEIDRLDQQATPGPWAVWPQMDEYGATYPEYLEGPKNDLFGARGWDGKHYIQEVPELTMYDAEFIAMARTALPKLASVIRRLRECAQTLTEDNNDASDYASGIHEAVECFEHIITNALEADDGY